MILDRASPDVTDAYKELLAVVIERGKAEEGVTRAVAELRRVGGSWNLIGPALGVSRQAARERYALVDKPDETKDPGHRPGPHAAPDLTRR